MYKQIIEGIMAQIASGVLKPGDQLPSIVALADMYECSQTQVKTAIAVLRQLEVVEGIQGKGVFVLPPKP